jgi:hypothetical protein
VPAATTPPTGTPDLQAVYFDPQSLGDAVARGPLIQGPCPGGTLNSPGLNLGTFPAQVGAGAAFYELALEAYLTQGQDTIAYNAAVNDFKISVTGGNEPGDCHPLYDWVESTQAAAFALLYGTPGFQAQVGADYVDRLKTFIQAEMLKENFAWNDANSFDSGMGQPARGDYSAAAPPATPFTVRTWLKTFNPNYFGSDDTVAACVYVFGGGATGGCNAELTGFNYAAFIAKLQTWGWKNMLSTFQNVVVVNGKSFSVQTLITQGGTDANGGKGKGATIPFVLGGDTTLDSNDILSQYSLGSSAVAEPSFKWTIEPFECATGVKKIGACASNPTKASLTETATGVGPVFGTVFNPLGDPEIGKPGEIYEFASTNAAYPGWDADEIRSDGLYGLQAWLHAVVGASFLQATNAFHPTANFIPYMTAGSEDFAYKLANCYFGDSSSGYRVACENVPAPPGNNPDLQGYRNFLAVWEEYIRPGFTGAIAQGPLPASKSRLQQMLNNVFNIHI